MFEPLKVCLMDYGVCISNPLFLYNHISNSISGSFVNSTHVAFKDDLKLQPNNDTIGFPDKQ